MPKVINENDVFKAVLKVVMARGYGNATTAEMATAANIHEATLFRKYESKARLVELAIENQLSDAPLTKVQYTGDLEADLKAILQAYVDTFQEHGAIIATLLLDMPRHPELKHTLQIPMTNIQGIMSIIEHYQKERILKEESPLLMVSILVGPIMVNQMLIQANLDMPIADIDLDEYVEGFLHGRKLT